MIEFRSSWLEDLNVENVSIHSPREIDPSILIGHLDLTSLNSIDTFSAIEELLRNVSVETPDGNVNVAAVCVYQPFVEQSNAYLKGKDIKVATVAGGFPFGQQDVEIKIADIKKSVALGADEIDVVINRAYPLTENWGALYGEVKACKEASAQAKLKVIMGTGDLEDPNLIAKTSMTCMMAGADFIKTSSGFEKVNATLEAGKAMTYAINRYYDLTESRVGIKPAGGIRTIEEASAWYSLVAQELDENWLTPNLFRIGASSLLTNLKEHLLKK